jgi:hypothetical protein
MSRREAVIILSGGPDDGGSKDLRNVGKLQPDYMAQYLRRKPSLYSPVWEHEISSKRVVNSKQHAAVPCVSVFVSQRSSGAISIYKYRCR